MSHAAIDASLPLIGATEFRVFRELIHRHTGIWLRDGKETMLSSRLSRRLRAHGMASFADYYQYLEQCQDGGEELGEFINCVTTNKTAFFREQHHFAFLAGVVVPEILARSRNRTASDAASPSRPTVRIWSAACSTGEEPYSIAISLLETQTQARASGLSDIRIVASDIDTGVLRKAVRGVYAADEMDGIEPALRKKYFLRGKDDMAGSVKVKKNLASLIEFQRINLMDRAWPLTGSFDAIFFRNALIYFQHDIQDLFLRRMSRLLKPGGYLFLGHSEHIPWLHNILEPLQQTIYRLRGAGA
jgi:chemotaxis protein methyltransferase CheR